MHRSGRTGRAGATGTVVALVTHEKKRDADRLLRSLDLDAPVGAPAVESLGTAGTRMTRPSVSSEAGAGGDSGGKQPKLRKREDRAATRSGSGKNRSGSRPSRNARGIKSIYVANLPWSATARDVTALFDRYGTVQNATVITDRRSGRSKGFGFVDMAAAGAARSAIAALHGSKLGGRDLTVRFAKPRRFGS